MTALGLLLGLMLAQRTARTVGVAPAQVWNLCVLALFAALIGARAILVLANWRDVVKHPLWILGLATVHHPLLIAASALFGGLAAYLYARAKHLPMLATADALAAPFALGAACEQLGALLAGSDYGKGTHLPWAVVYTDPLAARWSGVSLGVPLHPVQAYAAVAFLTLSILLLVVLPARRQTGDVAGMALMGAGLAVYVTELWRDWEGRGAVFKGGMLDGPQIAAIAMVLAGAVLLRERKSAAVAPVLNAEVGHE
jgi:phosphatidylglycerol:prolipoprotein diacylglycerol transferase